MGGIGFDTQYLEAASQTYSKGDLIYVNTAGAVAVCTDNASTTFQLDSEIAGIAMKAATGVTGTRVMFMPIRAGDVFIMNVYHGTAASAVTSLAHIGDLFAIRRASVTATGKWHVDLQGTTIEDATVAVAKARIIGFPRFYGTATNTIGDIYGYAYVTFLPYTIATDGAPHVRNLQFSGS
jgi:hypothetical protein